MDVTATPGMWKRTLWQGIAFATLWGCAYLFAPLAPLISLALPLVVCPAFTQGQIWFSLAAPLAPATAFLLGGGDWALALLMPAAPYLCLLILSQARRRRVGLHAEIAAYTGATVLGALSMLARLAVILGGSLFPQLSEAIVTALQRSVSSGNLLYRLVSFGVLSVPDAYVGTTTLQLGNFVILDPALQRELINVLRLRLTEGFADWIPALLAQGGLIIGLFTALHAARVQTRTRAVLPGDDVPVPSFRTLQLSRREQGYMLVLCVLTLLTGFADNAFLSLFSTLTYAFFSAVYQLLGAAVILTLLSRRRPERIAVYGVFAALLYLIIPFALFLLGVADQFMHLRDAGNASSGGGITP